MLTYAAGRGQGFPFIYKEGKGSFIAAFWGGKLPNKVETVCFAGAKGREM